MPQTSSPARLIGIGLIIIVAAVGYFFWQKQQTPSVPPYVAPTSTPAFKVATSSSAAPKAGITLATTPGSGSYKVSLAGSAPPAPDFKSSLVCTTASVDICAELKTQAEVQTAALAKNSQDTKAWGDLGSIRESAGDYQGARAAWEYVSLLSPGNTVSFSNLGDLYMNYLHEYAKAETNYLAQIRNKSDDISAYHTLYSLYINFLKQRTSAENILIKGIEANPKATDLEVLLARYYRDSGRTADAKAEYDAAIANAQSQGTTALATQIQEEKAGL